MPERGNRPLAAAYAGISSLVLIFWGGDRVLAGDRWNAFVGGILVGWILDALVEMRWAVTALRFLIAALGVAVIGMAPVVLLHIDPARRHAYGIGVFAGCTLAAAGAEWARSWRREHSLLETP